MRYSTLFLMICVLVISLVSQTQADYSLIDSASYNERQQAAFYCAYGASIYIWFVSIDNHQRSKIDLMLAKTANTINIRLDPNPYTVLPKDAIVAIVKYIQQGEYNATESLLINESYTIGLKTGSALLACRSYNRFNDYSSRNSYGESYFTLIGDAQSHCRKIGIPDNIIDSIKMNLNSDSSSDLLQWHGKIVKAIAGPAPVKRVNHTNTTTTLKIQAELCRGIHLNPVGTSSTMSTYEGELVLLNVSKRNLTLNKIKTIFCNSKNKGVELETTKPAKAGKKSGFFIAPGKSERIHISSDGYTNGLILNKGKGSLYLFVIVTGYDGVKKPIIATFGTSLPPLNKLPSIGDKRRSVLKMNPVILR